MQNPTRLPHSLRFVIFFLRLAVGLNFFYLGWSVLFEPSIKQEISRLSMNMFYSWLQAPAAANWPSSLLAWGALVIGACLTAGFFTRLAAFAGIGLIMLSYLPTVNVYDLRIFELINVNVIISLCLLVIIFSKAGNYLGLDKFLKMSLFSRNRAA